MRARDSVVDQAIVAGGQLDCLEYTQRSGKVRGADTLEFLSAQRDQCRFDLGAHRASAVGQPDRLGTAVGRVVLPYREARAAELVEQAHQRRTLDADVLGQRALADTF